jgi:hypothetical protein
MKGILLRYNPLQIGVILKFLDKLAQSTRKTGEISWPAKGKIVESFGAYDVDVVIEALQIYLQMDIPSAQSGRGKNEKYVRGIMANKQADKDRRVGDVNGEAGAITGSAKENGKHTPDYGDEGERIQRIAESISSNGGGLDCDF